MSVHGVMRKLLQIGVVLLAGCAGNEDPAPVDRTPLDQRLATFATLQNAGDWEGVRSHLTSNAQIQSPVTLRPVGVDTYLKTVEQDPYKIQFLSTEIVYAFSDRAMTRSAVSINLPGQPTFRDRVAVDWEREDGYWRISQMTYSDWPSLAGIWRRSGLRQEGSIELQVLPGGRYVVYTKEDYTVPAFKGDYIIEGNQISFSDISAYEASQYDSGKGRYSFLLTPTGMTLRKISEDNSWREKRYDGSWSAGQ